MPFYAAQIQCATLNRGTITIVVKSSEKEIVAITWFLTCTVLKMMKLTAWAICMYSCTYIIDLVSYVTLLVS